MAEINEALLTTNNFKRPKVVSGSKALTINILRLIMMEPGSRPDIPMAGLGLKSRYSFLSEDIIPELTDELYEQLALYLPEAQEATVEFKFIESENAADQNKLSIYIQVGDDITEINMDDNTSENGLITKDNITRLSDL